MVKLNIIITTLLLLFSWSALAKKTSGTVRLVKGTVSLQKKGSERLVSLKIGSKVHAGDTIISGKDSRAKIKMIDSNVINVSPDTMLVVEEYEYDPSKFDKKVSLKLLFGKIRTIVNQRYDKENPFKIKTPSAEAEVGGTDFFTSYNTNSNSTRIVTFEGKVDFSSFNLDGKLQGSVQVSAGMSSSNKINQAPTPPVMLPKAEIASLDSKSLIETPKQTNKEKRAPASAQAIDHSPVFIAEEDLGICQTCTPAPVGPALDLPGPSPVRVRLPDSEVCESCKRIIEDGNTSVNINLIPVGN